MEVLGPPLELQTSEVLRPLFSDFKYVSLELQTLEVLRPVFSGTQYFQNEKTLELQTLEVLRPLLGHPARTADLGSSTAGFQ